MALFKKKEEKQLTPEEAERKRISRNRIFYGLVILDVLLVIYLVYAIILSFTA